MCDEHGRWKLDQGFWAKKLRAVRNRLLASLAAALALLASAG
jgi:hypothetical protein